MQTTTSLARDYNPGCARMNLKIVYSSGGAVGSFRGMRLSDAAPPKSLSTGQLTITLDRPVKGGIMGFYGGFQGAVEANLTPIIVSDLSQTTGVITVETRVAAGTPTNPGTGDILWLEIIIDENGQPF